MGTLFTASAAGSAFEGEGILGALRALILVLLVGEGTGGAGLAVVVVLGAEVVTGLAILRRVSRRTGRSVALRGASLGDLTRWARSARLSALSGERVGWAVGASVLVILVGEGTRPAFLALVGVYAELSTRLAGRWVGGRI
jgi:hypothetical protein